MRRDGKQNFQLTDEVYKMGRERQKRKNRSSRSLARPKVLGRTKAGKKKVSFLNNETIAKNW